LQSDFLSGGQLGRCFPGRDGHVDEDERAGAGVACGWMCGRWLALCRECGVEWGDWQVLRRCRVLLVLLEYPEPVMMSGYKLVVRPALQIRTAAHNSFLTRILPPDISCCMNEARKSSNVRRLSTSSTTAEMTICAILKGL